MRGAALADFLAVGERLQVTVEPAGLLEGTHHAVVDVDHRRRLGQREAERLGLEVAAAQHPLADRVGHLGEQLVALLGGQVAVGDDRVEQDLDVDLVVGAVDAARVVDRVGVDPATGERVLDASALRQPQVPALPYHARPELAGVDADRVVGLVADVGVVLRGRLDVGADPAVPEQVDRGAQQRADELRGREPIGLDPERRLRGLRHGDRLGGARPHAAALGDQRGVVVRPGGARQLEQPLALGEAGRRIGLRVEEHVTVIEGGDELDVRRQQHAVAEHVAGHVADPHDGELARSGCRCPARGSGA